MFLVLELDGFEKFWTYPFNANVLDTNARLKINNVWALSLILDPENSWINYNTICVNLDGMVTLNV